MLGSLVIVNSLNHPTLGPIEGIENDGDVLVAYMSVFSSPYNSIDRPDPMDTTSSYDRLGDNSARGVFMYGNYGNDEIY